MLNDYKCPKCGIIIEYDDKTDHICKDCNCVMIKVYSSCNVIISCKGTYKGDSR